MLCSQKQKSPLQQDLGTLKQVKCHFDTHLRSSLVECSHSAMPFAKKRCWSTCDSHQLHCGKSNGRKGASSQKYCFPTCNIPFPLSEQLWDPPVKTATYKHTGIRSQPRVFRSFRIVLIPPHTPHWRRCLGVQGGGGCEGLDDSFLSRNCMLWWGAGDLSHFLDHPSFFSSSTWEADTPRGEICNMPSIKGRITQGSERPPLRTKDLFRSPLSS